MKFEICIYEIFIQSVIFLQNFILKRPPSYRLITISDQQKSFLRVPRVSLLSIGGSWHFVRPSEAGHCRTKQIWHRILKIPEFQEFSGQLDGCRGAQIPMKIPIIPICNMQFSSAEKITCFGSVDIPISTILKIPYFDQSGYQYPEPNFKFSTRVKDKKLLILKVAAKVIQSE